VYGSPITGQLLSGDSAIIGVDAAGKALTVDTNRLDVRYRACPSLEVLSPSGGKLALAALQVGDFATVTVDTAVPCLSRVSLLAAPQPPQCKALNSGGDADVTWVDFDQAAQSVVYTPTGSGEPTVAVHWCAPPTVVGATATATTLAAIPAGALLQITFSGNLRVTGVTVQK
jgi:hypothetical protein